MTEASLDVIHDGINTRYPAITPHKITTRRDCLFIHSGPHVHLHRPHLAYHIISPTPKGESHEVMLAFSGISEISQVSSGVSQDVDLDLVEQIIENAPRSATTFPLVYRAYGEVLEKKWVFHLISRSLVDAVEAATAAD